MNGINTSQSADNRLVGHQIQNQRDKHIIIWIDNTLVRHQIQTRVNGTEKQTIRTANTTTVKD
jgi:hypothetical protein